ncbi:uncharacterized protein LOC141671422 isoform X2 [Apium graveolens]|uniref:uncharacterized protein LOC141671422 isoform X2 n=1 Tax=Apium graveolens TaxID=4045 RepID=UPI003D78B7DF
MAQEAVVRHVPVNPCCELLQKKETKLSQKLAKSEEGRNFLKKAIGILQEKITNFDAENVKLKAELELARKKADDGEKKIEELASRDTLENEISSLRSEISSLKQKDCSGSEDKDKKVADLQASVSEAEKEISILKEQLEKERKRAVNEQKMAEIELKKANEALETAKAEMARVEQLQADNEREMKMNESTIRDSLESEISSLKSQIKVLQEQTVLVAQDANKEATLLQECVSEQKEEINRLKELFQIEKDRADSEKKKSDEAKEKADDEKNRAEKVLSESETELRVKELAVRVSLEDEISSLKSQIALLQKPAVLGAQDVNKDIILLQDCISNKEKEINKLHELLQIEKDRADSERNKAEEEKKKVDEKKGWAEKLIAEKEKEMKLKETALRLPLENEIASLKSHIELLQQQVVSGVQDVNEETVIYERRVSERETEINRLKKLLQKEKKRAGSEEKKAETEKCRADKVLADSEISLKEKEQAVRLSLGTEISALESQIHLLQQEIAVRDEKKEVNLYQSLVSKKDAEINQLKKLAEKEKRRAESEKKKVEAGKKKVIESQKIAMTEKTRADEERRIADIEREKVEEASLQLEMLRAKVHELKANLELEALKVQQANEILETEKQKVIIETQRADMEMAKAEEQSKVLETTRKEIVEERARADSLSLQLEEDRVRIVKLQKEIAEHVSSRSTGNNAGDLFVEHLGLEAVKLKGGPHIEVLDQEARASMMVFNCLQCEELIKKLRDVKQEAKREKERADSEMRKAEYQRKVAETYGEKAKMETERCRELADELKDNRCKTEKLKKEMQELAASGKMVNTVERKDENFDATNMKLLRKSLKLERMQTKHAKEVARLEKDRNILLQQEIRRIKEAFFGITNQLDILDKCSSHRDVGINDLEKNSNVRRQGKKRKLSEEKLCQVHHSGNELVKSSSTLDACDTFKHRKQCTAPLLSSKECTEPLSGIDSELLPLLGGSQQTLLKTRAKNSCKASFPDRALLGSQEGWALSAGEMDKLAEGATNLQLTVLGPFNNISKPIDNNINSRPMSNATGITYACNEETGDANRNCLGSFDEVEDGNYLKLLSLDDPLDEEIYRVAIERPLSPTLPVIEPLRVGTHENSNNDHIDVVSLVSNSLVSLCSPNEEIDSSKFNAYTSGTSHVPPLPEKLGLTGSHEIMEKNDMGHASDPSNLGQTFTGHKRLNVSSGSKSQPACSLRYYVIFSDISSDKNITKILSATRTCMAQCSMLPQTDHVVQVMSTLSKVKGLLSREMVCVFFSLLLQNVPEFTLENFKNVSDGGLVRSFELFTEQVHSVMDDLETRSIEELLNLDELLSLIEDFLIHRRVLIHRDDVLSESLPLYDPKSDIIVSDGDMLSFQAASDQQLISASVVLVSICLAIDDIGFVCETSYNLLKMRKIDSSTLAILHVFAYISGAKYLNNCDHSLSMTVLKSLVTVFEREMSSTSVVQLGFPPCTNCPYVT